MDNYEEASHHARVAYVLPKDTETSEQRAGIEAQLALTYAILSLCNRIDKLIETLDKGE